MYVFMSLVLYFLFVFVFLFGGWCSQVLLGPPSVTGGTKHIETVQTAATASKVYIQKKSEEITIRNVDDLGTLVGFDMSADL